MTSNRQTTDSQVNFYTYEIILVIIIIIMIIFFFFSLSCKTYFIEYERVLILNVYSDKIMCTIVK